MKCPHCMVEFHDSPTHSELGGDIDGEWGIIWRTCPSCDRYVIQLHQRRRYKTSGGGTITQGRGQGVVRLIHPKAATRPPCPRQVPKDLANDYHEACLVLPDSAKASAALSRRCLQHLLREQAKVKVSDLADEIQQVIDSGSVPTHIVEAIDSIRIIGNFAAHPIKSKSIGEIVDVEPGEAEWNLDVLEALFDFYFVQPEILLTKRASLNKKLREAGKPLMK